MTWGVSAGLLGARRKVGVIAGDRASDQVALNQYLLPDLERAGVTPVVETIAADPSDTASTNTQAPLVVQQLRADGVTSVIPLIPFNVFFPVLAAETQQQYFPRLLLSDYEYSIESALGSAPVPLREGARRARGPHDRDARRHRRHATRVGGGLRPRGAQLLHHLAQGLSPDAARATRTTSSKNRGRSKAGARRSACSPPAATAAGRNLDRRTFDAAMATITELPRRVLPGPDLRTRQVLGPTQYRVVRLHTNSPPVEPVQVPAEPHTPGGVLGRRRTTGSRCRDRDDRRSAGVASPGELVADRRSSTRSTRGRSPTPTATASATCRGVIDRLDHLEWLGIDGIWLSPITVSPNADWGYDVADYCAVQPDLGTMAIFDRLVAEAADRGIRVLLDLVPNHTSEQTPVVRRLPRPRRTAPKRDWYVWADPKPDGAAARTTG